MSVGRTQHSGALHSVFLTDFPRQVRVSLGEQPAAPGLKARLGAGLGVGVAVSCVPFLWVGVPARRAAAARLDLKAFCVCGSHSWWVAQCAAFHFFDEFSLRSGEQPADRLEGCLCR